MRPYRVAIVGLSLVVWSLATAREGIAIVDVRIDAAYRQIEPSTGDEWAPTWSRDDILYTGNNDGAGFGDMSPNAITFGKLEGADPYALKGAVTNRMLNFREGQQTAEAAKWKTMDTYRRGPSVYRFIPCGFDGARSMYSCLIISLDEGRSWIKGDESGGGNDLFKGTRFGAPTFISFRKEFESAMGSPEEYAFAAAYAGVVDGEASYVLGRVPIQRLARRDVRDWSFRQADWTWKTDLSAAARTSNSTGLGPDGANWKTTNSYSVDGVLYMFVTRCHYPFGSTDTKRRHIFQNSSILKSTDNGRTWLRSAEDNLKKPMFPGRRFGAAYFVWYGKDGAAQVDNADRYVYAVSNNGHFENGDDYVLGRVLRSKLPGLTAGDWTFYARGDGLHEASWTPSLGEATPVLVNPERSSMTGMTYIDGLRRYVMVSWHYKYPNFEAGAAAGDLSTVLEFFEAPKPWGPWSKLKSMDTRHLGWFAPIIGQRFQTMSDRDTVSAFLYASGFRTLPSGELDMSMYKLNYVPISLSTKPLKHADPAFVGER